MTRRRVLLGGGACAVCALGAVAGLSPSAASASVDAAEDAFASGDDHRSASTWTDTRASREAVQPDSVFRVDTTRPLVGLTFDDGPDPRYTSDVLDVLAQHRARATFFVVGVNALAHPDLIARQLEGGHGVGNHTYDHAELTQLSATRVKAEIDRGALAIEGAGAPRLRLFRPPKGHTDHIVDVVADAAQYRTIFWDLCLERFVGHHGVRRGVDALLDRVRPGSIILAHDGGHVLAPLRPHIDRSKTVEALPLLLAGLATRGLQPVDVPSLLRADRISGPR
jgi:peptidoglycan/xylan/chitin deacetylase (PgdA/CDA1 family)